MHACHGLLMSPVLPCQPPGQVELENWVESSRPLTQAEKLRAFVLEAGLFKASPRSGALQPGQCTQVRGDGLAPACVRR
jgi:hypothetical protein